MQTPRDKIRELRALLDEGLLSEQEFSQRKNAILDSEFAPGMQDDDNTSFAEIGVSTDLGFLAGQEVGGFSKRYRLERLLGQGGMGQVWLAIDLATQAELGHSEMVALKILPPQLTQSSIHTRLLIEEASIVRKLAHENIVRVYEWAQDPATCSYFIIMEYLDGQDLESYLAAHGPCSLKQVLTLLMPVAHALQYAWEKHRLVHRDLKPGNLLLTKQGDIKLLDFGISARLRSHTNAGIGLNTSSKPFTKMPGAGTAGYRAPEAGTQQNLFCPKLDVYAFAVMVLEMLTGALPFIESEEHRSQQIVLATQRPATLNAAQWQVLRSGFATDPKHRPDSVLALLNGIVNAAVVPATTPYNAKQSAGINQPTTSAISQTDASALFRAEQRRQRKELEQQRRQQASASLQVLIARQREMRTLEQQGRNKRHDDASATKIRIEHINAAHDMKQRVARNAQVEGEDLFAAPIGSSLIKATNQSNALESDRNDARLVDNFLDTDAHERMQSPVRISVQAPLQTSMHAQSVVDNGMSWEHAKQYLASISEKTGEQVRLPSEAEWENLRHSVSKKLERW